MTCTTPTFGRLEEYVSTGGFVWVEAASLGVNGGEFGDGVLPGGGTIVEGVFEIENDVVDAAHPTMADVPNPFTGNAASHSAFEDLPRRRERDRHRIRFGPADGGRVPVG